MTDPDLRSELVQRHFAVAGEQLTVGETPVADLARRFGTPLFIYDGAVMRRAYRALAAALDGFAHIHYSVKANPDPAIISLFLSEGAGVEIASAGEYRRARAAGARSDQILFAGPGKRQAELDEVIAGGVGEIHVETVQELDRLEAIAASNARPINIAVRINPVAAAQGGAMRMGGKPTAFGFDEEDLAEVLAAVAARRHLKLTGVHVFAGTQILDANVLLAQWSYGIDLAERVVTACGHSLATVDLGGGLGIPYFEGDAALDLDVLSRGVGDLKTRKAGSSVRDARFIVEPGRFLAGPAGLYVVAVNAIKRSRGVSFVVVDGGMHHHLAASGNLGQVIKRDYPLLAVARMADKPVPHPVTVVGPLCTPLDTLARNAHLPDMQPGDLLAVMQSGAYGLTASPSGFLSHPAPAEVLVDGTAILLLARAA